MKHNQPCAEKDSCSAELNPERSLKQRIEEVLKKNGLEPKWDYSKAGQSVIMPAWKKDSGK